jgi:hypothetical protein
MGENVTRGARAGLAAVAIALAPAVARAEPPTITANDYAIEAVQGPLIAPNRIIGLAGATTAYAEGVEGNAVNAASAAVRTPYSFQWLDLDLDVGIAFPGAYGGTDFDNRGDKATAEDQARTDSFLFLNAGAQLQLGQFGAAITGEALQYDLAAQNQTATPGLTLRFARWHALGAYGIAGGQLVVGAGLRDITAQVLTRGSALPFGSGVILTMNGLSPEVGVIVKPDDRPFRIGFTARAPVEGKTFGSDLTTRDANGVQRAGPFILPTKIVEPWELEAGFALQLGARPLNPRWIDPHEHEAPIREQVAKQRAARHAQYAAELAAAPAERIPALRAELAARERAIASIEDQELESRTKQLLAERKARFLNWPRERILLVASVLVTGASPTAVSLAGFIDQKRELVGQSISLSPRFGIESEPVVGWVKGRVGSYLEPSRYLDGFPRQHFTFGADVKLFPFDFFGLLGETTWRVSFVGDIAPRYTDFGLAIGPWH